MSIFKLVIDQKEYKMDKQKCIDHVLKTIEIRNFYTSIPTKFNLFKDHL